MVTAAVVVLLIVITLIIDLILLLGRGIHATISWWLWDMSHNFPVIPFLFGVVAGHWFWSQTC